MLTLRPQAGLSPGHRKRHQPLHPTGAKFMTTRLNAAFAATLATAFSFAFVIAAMPLSALSATGLA